MFYIILKVFGVHRFKTNGNICLDENSFRYNRFWQLKKNVFFILSMYTQNEWNFIYFFINLC